MGLSALITGGASGMGAALAAKLASRGIGLFIADLQTSQGLSVAKSISEEYKVPVDFHQVDITQEKEVKRMVETATRRTGRLDYAANCAGICEKIWAEEESITTDMFDKLVTRTRPLRRSR
jgi:NAD(P)-dependent dehydrogenase (short-subunit alcohol dehydrogenase family)